MDQNNISTWTAADTMTIVNALVPLFAFIVGYGLAVSAGRTKSKPILVFSYETGAGWFLSNVGKGPALNATVAMKGQNGDWKHYVRLNALPEGSKFQLIWLGKLDVPRLGAVYEDSERTFYTTIFKNDKNGFFRRAKIGISKDAVVMRYWNLMPMITKEDLK
ncbi:MAG TPA: hypothetical protein VFE53_01825 [Mucilaginibacter sp.]|jgi:hypothetical protein|nr:hypothetical protein [Mucilaginibacter sp.]